MKLRWEWSENGTTATFRLPWSPLLLRATIEPNKGVGEPGEDFVAEIWAFLHGFLHEQKTRNVAPIYIAGPTREHVREGLDKRIREVARWLSDVYREDAMCYLHAVAKIDALLDAADESLVKVPVLVNGAICTTVELPPDASESYVRAFIMGNDAVRDALLDQVEKKFMYVPGKVVSIVATPYSIRDTFSSLITAPTIDVAAPNEAIPMTIAPELPPLPPVDPKTPWLLPRHVMRGGDHNIGYVDARRIVRVWAPEDDEAFHETVGPLCDSILGLLKTAKRLEFDGALWVLVSLAGGYLRDHGVLTNKSNQLVAETMNGKWVIRMFVSHPCQQHSPRLVPGVHELPVSVHLDRGSICRMVNVEVDIDPEEVAT